MGKKIMTKPALAKLAVCVNLVAFASLCHAQSDAPASGAEAAAAAEAPQPSAPDDSAPGPNAAYFVGGAAAGLPLGTTVKILATEGSVMGRVVKDKPYTADAITESTQVLADGNRIEHVNRAHIYRDSAGRTRREQTLASPEAGTEDPQGATLITIDDPVAHVSYLLNSETKTAQMLKAYNFSTSAAQARPASGAGAAGTFFLRRIAPAGTAPVLPPGVALPPAGVALPPAGVAPPSGAALPAPFPVGIEVTAETAATQTTTTTEDLGDEVLQGVTAHGVRHTTTIAAGAIGNEMPIEIVSERWYAPTLDAVVLQTVTDPRFGKTTYRLVNVVLGEPPSELFTLPEDYTVKAAPAPRVLGAVPEAVQGKRVMIIRRDRLGSTSDEGTGSPGTAAPNEPSTPER